MVVYLNEFLKKQDEKPWLEVMKYMGPDKNGNEVQVERVVGWETALSHSGHNTIYVVDEADKFFVDDTMELPPAYKSVIAFTATVPQDEQEGETVRSRLTSLGFEVINELGFE